MNSSASYPACLLARLQSCWKIGQRSSWLLNLGCGSGEAALAWSANGARVTALDRSEAAIAQVQALAEKAQLEVIAHQAPAEATGLAAARYDAVVALQTWLQFDPLKAAKEAERLLVSGGALVLAQRTALSQPGNLIEATNRLIEMHVSFWLDGAGEGFFPEWAGQMSQAGFQRIESFTYDLDLIFSPQDWRDACHHRLSTQLDADGLEKFDQDLQVLLESHWRTGKQKDGALSGGRLAVPHRVFALRGLKP